MMLRALVHRLLLQKIVPLIVLFRLNIDSRIALYFQKQPPHIVISGFPSRFDGSLKLGNLPTP